MKRILPLLFILFATSMVAQTTPTTLPATPAVPASPGGVIPGVDGVTICLNGANQYVICTGANLTLGNVSVTGLTLNAGASPAVGTYLVSVTANPTAGKPNVVGFTPYVPPVAPSTYSTTFPVTAQNISPQSGTALFYVSIPSGMKVISLRALPPISASTTTYSPYAVFPVLYQANSTAPLQAEIQIKCIASNVCQLPAGTWTLAVN